MSKSDSEIDVYKLYSSLILNLRDKKYLNYLNKLNLIYEKEGIESLNSLNENSSSDNTIVANSDQLINAQNVEKSAPKDFFADFSTKKSAPKDFFVESNILQAFKILVDAPQQHKNESYIDMFKLFINKTNLIIFWNFVFGFDNKLLNKLCYNCLNDNFEFIVSNDSNLADLQYLIMKHITSADYLPLSEIKLFKLVCKWTTLNSNHSKKKVTSLFNNIRYPMISANELINIVYPSGLINDNTYAKALEYNYDNSKADSNQKIYRKRIMSVNFYVCDKNRIYPGYKKITNDDLKSDEFQKKLITFINLHGGIYSFTDFSTDNLYKMISVDDLKLQINGETVYLNTLKAINYRSHEKNNIALLYNSFTKIISTVNSISVGTLIYSDFTICVEDI